MKNKNDTAERHRRILASRSKDYMVKVKVESVKNVQRTVNEDKLD